jgi:hypothetical protein
MNSILIQNHICKLMHSPHQNILSEVIGIVLHSGKVIEFKCNVIVGFPKIMFGLFIMITYRLHE